MSKELDAWYGISWATKHVAYGTREIIENGLKRLEQQDSVLKILKEVIEFAQTLPHIEPNKDNGFDVMSAVGINIQRDIRNRERELLRKWVLETCFPKELKALEIIKENIKHFIDFEDNTNRVYIDCAIDCKTQEKYDLLKEYFTNADR